MFTDTEVLIPILILSALASGKVAICLYLTGAYSSEDLS